MARQLNLTNKNSNEIYTLHFPKNLLGFLKFDFTVFMERSTDLCRLYMKTGAYKHEEVLEVRNSISGCHKFVEQNIRGIFDKIVVDCWIEYICRLNEIGTVTLWNNFIPCRTDFEKAIFSRLSEYRHNMAINQWVNILKIQEYAKTKVEFIFGQSLKNLQEASTKTNYFDLMFNVAANELGYDVGEIAENKIYSLGRTPNSPFIMSNVSREIVRSMFADLKYFEDTKHKPKKGEFIADQTAMDAFSAIKAYIPAENDLALGTMIKALNEASQKVYIPTSFKAVIDLEIDAILDSGAIIQRCGRCREYFMRHDEYDHDYCDRVNREGKSCIEIMSNDGKSTRKIDRQVDATLLSLRCDQLYREMSARVNVDLTQRDFSDWYKYMMLIRDNVLNGEATLEDFENFIEYSHSMAFIPQHSKEKNEETGHTTVSSPSAQDEHGRVVKPFVFEKVDRSELEAQNEFLTTEKGGRKRHKNDVSEEYSPQAYSIPEFDPPRRIIRGASAESYERPLDNSRTVNSRMQSQLDSVLENTAFHNANEEDDIKIYNVKNEAPEPKREFVKVFEPGRKKRAAQNNTSSIALTSVPVPTVKKEQSTLQERRTEMLDSFLQSSSAAAERQLEHEKSKKEKEREQRPETKATYAANAYRNTGTFNIPSMNNQRGTEPSQSTYNSGMVQGTTGRDIEKFQEEQPRRQEPQSNEQPTDFTSILLKGIERKDGFEDSEIPTDSDGMPVSHKTKRVMDAIFKPSKPSLFININKDE